MPSSKIAGSYGGSIFSSSRNPHAVLKMSVLIYCPTHSVPGFPFLHTLLATDSVSVFALVSTVAIPHGARWQLVVALVCILLVMTDLEQFFFFFHVPIWPFLSHFGNRLLECIFVELSYFDVRHILRIHSPYQYGTGIKTDTQVNEIIESPKMGTGIYSPLILNKSAPKHP